jgi:uncharacterized protein YpmB
MLAACANSNDKSGRQQTLSLELAEKLSLEQNLLTEVTLKQYISPGGPLFTMIQGKDESGEEKILWYRGDSHTPSYTSYVKDGISKDVVLDILKTKGISNMNIAEMYIAPDITRNLITWFVREVGNHCLWFDFKTGKQVWESPQDPNI